MNFYGGFLLYTNCTSVGKTLKDIIMDALSSTVYPDNPYIDTNYDEDYCGQYHFSSQSGWMNDINGLWYYNGIYHLAYQNNPQGVTANYPADPMHWGHAASTDLIHWVQQPVMLEPGVNVPGDCWSGSTVVDTDNDSGLKQVLIRYLLHYIPLQKREHVLPIVMTWELHGKVMPVTQYWLGILFPETPEYSGMQKPVNG